jgi:hypothetical protein
MLSLGLGVFSPLSGWALPIQVEKLTLQVEDLQKLVDRQEWFNVRSYIGGQMGRTRIDLQDAAQVLNREQRQRVTQLSRRMATDLVKISQSAEKFDQAQMAEAQKDLRQTVIEIEKTFATAES